MFKKKMLLANVDKYIFNVFGVIGMNKCFFQGIPSSCLVKPSGGQNAEGSKPLQPHRGRTSLPPIFALACRGQPWGGHHAEGSEPG